MVDPARTEKYFPEIQALRGFAALCVVLTHAFLQAGWLNIKQGMALHPSLGEFGVDIFFVISGFIMVYISRDGFAQTGASLAFLRKRLIRIAPLYWLMSGVLIVVILVLPRLINNPEVDLVYWLKSLLFIPATHPQTGDLRPVLVVGWTLQFEMFFYALFALSLMFSRTVGLAGLVASIVIFVVFGQLLEPENTLLRFYSQPIMLEFAGGACLGWLFINGIRLPKMPVWAMFGVAALSYFVLWKLSFYVSLDRAVYFGIPAFIVVGSLTIPRGAGSVGTLWQRAGDSSYALYLSHVFVIAALGYLVDFSGIEHWRDNLWMSGGFVMVAVISSVIIGWWVHRWVELPIGKFLHKKRMVTGLTRNSLQKTLPANQISR